MRSVRSRQFTATEHLTTHSFRNIEIVKYMFENGADVHAVDENNRTLLTSRADMLEESGKSADDIEKDESFIMLIMRCEF